ncbi:MAG: hypothetical protein A3E01_02860 [Gammaproteobacteria bacterium RIFCSPHIGHO2_12_FULL_63_22]|nr:MAG: hypothetical protein A3E01_02860 [Gammaproteobacteria bacterium RIFCSPHIGHO2_12_FULL_63_22]
MGWVPPDQRSLAVRRMCESILSSMPRFFIFGQTQETDRKRVVLWDAAKQVLGKHLPTLLQKSGCCVGEMGKNVVDYVAVVEIANGDAEQFHPIFMPYGYGRGRLHSGIRGRGEGSTGSGQAKAIVQDGVIRSDLSGLPQPSGGDSGLTWGAEVEMKWSDGARIEDKWIELGKLHPIKSAAPVQSYTQARDALANGYPVGVCSDRGFTMDPQLDRKAGKKFGVPRGTWHHAMTFIGVDDDPQRPAVYCQNSWSADAHGPPAGDEPPGGFWVDADVADYMLRQNDSFAYSQFEGFPEQLWDFV